MVFFTCSKTVRELYLMWAGVRHTKGNRHGELEWRTAFQL